MANPGLDLDTPAGTLRGVAEPRGGDAVVYVHGFGSDHQGSKAHALRERCAESGWGFAAFDFRGHGGSWGTMKDLRASALQADLDAVAGHLASVGVRRLFLVGSSMGGFAAAWFAARRPELVPAVALIAPAFGFLQRRCEKLTPEQHDEGRRTGRLVWASPWLGEVELSYGLLEERDDFLAENLARRWKAPALVFHGMADDTVDWQDTARWVSGVAAGPVELRLYRDGDHRLAERGEEIALAALRFFTRWR